MEKIIKYIWFTIKGISPRKLMMLLEYFPTIEELYYTPKYDFLPYLSLKERKELSDKSLDRAESVYKRCIESGVIILTIEDTNYPQILKETSSPPIVLYQKGKNINLNNEFCIGVVGTRHSTAYGERIATKFCRTLAQEDITVVSGLALGIDSIAARAVVSAKRPTIAVLGCGIDVVYPSSNRELYAEVEKYGVIISEYPPGTPPATWTFPRRNRIIAGLSRGVIIVEGSKKSGSLITANLALEYNRDVFAIPRNIDDYGLDGTNYLIKQGAIPMTCIDDLKECYPELSNRAKSVDGEYFTYNNEQVGIDDEYASKPQNTAVKFSAMNRNNPDEEKILVSIGEDKSHVDKISLETGIDPNMLATKLTILEIEGVVEQLPGKFYRIK